MSNQNIITKDPLRRLNAWVDGKTLIIQELKSLVWIHSADTRKWSDTRIAITLDELAILADRSLPTAALLTILSKRGVKIISKRS